MCGRVFNSQQGIRRHELVHQGRTVCGVCGRAFSRSDSLKRHVLMIHSGQETRAPQPPAVARPAPVVERVPADGSPTVGPDLSAELLWGGSGQP